jgi:uncharacterized protein (TIGR03000 family)
MVAHSFAEERNWIMRGFLGLVFALAVMAPAQPVAAADEKAPVIIRMMVPANAEVWFDGVKTTQTGSLRQFVSPALVGGKAYSYRVRIVAGGEQSMDVTQPLAVRAGDRLTIDFRGGQARIIATGAGYYDPDAQGPAPAGATVPPSVPAAANPTPQQPFDSQTNRQFDNPPQG